MKCVTSLELLLLASFSTTLAGDPVAITDGINFNAGSQVRIRGTSNTTAPVRISVHYAGENTPVRTVAIQLNDAYVPLWDIPYDARTGRYEVDIDRINVTSFAVHRKLAAIERVDLDRTFYTNGDPIDCGVTVRNSTN